MKSKFNLRGSDQIFCVLASKRMQRDKRLNWTLGEEKRPQVRQLVELPDLNGLLPR